MPLCTRGLTTRQVAAQSDVVDRRAGRVISAASRTAPAAPRRADVGIVIAARDAAHVIEGCIAAVGAYLATQPYRARIVVVDRGSVDGTADRAARLERAGLSAPIHLVGCSRPGRGAAISRGLEVAAARRTVIVDAHDPDPANTITRALRLPESYVAAIDAAPDAARSSRFGIRVLTGRRRDAVPGVVHLAAARPPLDQSIRTTRGRSVQAIAALQVAGDLPS